ncbi:unnamed protein product [Allacma fusca]|uniref:Uncharacterized protein n=1 Tax=Allacma fusca TaxID=39272 RepID=A0A8J2PBW1_9HEXA|nr:unnamed protein product [Allacma fusca]
MKTLVILCLVMTTIFAQRNGYNGQIRIEATPSPIVHRPYDVAAPNIPSNTAPGYRGYQAKEYPKTGPNPTINPLFRGNLENDQQGKYNLNLALHPLFDFRMTFPDLRQLNQTYGAKPVEVQPKQGPHVG